MSDTDILDSTSSNIVQKFTIFKSRTDAAKKKMNESIIELRELLTKIDGEDDFGVLKQNIIVDFCNNRIDHSFSKKDINSRKQFLYTTALFYYLQKLNNNYKEAYKIMINKYLEAQVKVYDFLNTF